MNEPPKPDLEETFKKTLLALTEADENTAAKNCQALISSYANCDDWSVIGAEHELEYANLMARFDSEKKCGGPEDLQEAPLLREGDKFNHECSRIRQVLQREAGEGHECYVAELGTSEVKEVCAGQRSVFVFLRHMA